MEIENTKKSLFHDNNVTPIVLIYGEINDYTMNLISKKKIFNYPIYNISDEAYNKFIRKYDVNNDPLVVNKDGEIIYIGDPLGKVKKMNSLVKILDKI